MTLEKLKTRIAELKGESIPLATEERLLAASKLRHYASQHNFDNGYDELYKTLAHPFCDRSTALQLYWQSRPLFFLNNPNAQDNIHSENLKFKEDLEEKLKRGAFTSILEIDPLDFAINTMGAEDEFESKSEYLDQIPIECVLPISYKEQARVFHHRIPKKTTLKGIRYLFLFDFQDFKSLQELEEIENIEEVTISSNPYNRKKPKKRKFEELLMFKNARKLHLGFHSKFSNLEDIHMFQNLTDLRMNFELEDEQYLPGLTGLRSLSYISEKNTTISTLTEMSNLENLTILSCPKLNDISGIEKLKKLTGLKIRLVRKLKEIKPIATLNLKTLILSEVDISSKKMEVISDIPIETLQLDCKKMTNLNFLVKEGKLINSLKSIYLYRLDSAPALREKIKGYDLSKYKVVELDMNNSL